MRKSKGMQLGALLAAMLLVTIALVPAMSAQGANKEKIAKGSSQKIAVLGDPSEIEEPLVKSVGANNIYTSPDINSANIEQANIIFINSSYLKNLIGTKDKEVVASKLKTLAHSGKPMIVLGSNPEILYKYIEPKLTVIDLKWEQQKIVALGVLIFPDNTSITKFMPGEISKGAEEMLNWASERLTKGKPTDGNVSAQTASWSWVGDVEWTSSDNLAPHGRFNGIFSTYVLTEDGSSTYNWYNHKVQPQTIPGFYLYSSDWRNDYLWTKINADFYQDNDVIDYDPKETSGTSTASVNIGVTAGEGGAGVTSSQSWSYSISDVAVHDHTDFSTDIAHWEHEITNADSGSAKNTYTGKPGATVRTAQSNQYYQILVQDDARYRDPGIWDDFWTAPWVVFGIQVTQ